MLTKTKKQESIRIVIAVLVVLGLAGGLILAQKAKHGGKATFKIEGKDTGSVLLNEVILMFENRMSMPGDQFKPVIYKDLERLAMEARIARTEQKVDKLFYERYMRVLRVIKLVLANDQKEHIFNPLIEAEVNKFESQKDFHLPNTKKIGIGAVAGALAEELLSIKSYVDKELAKR